MLTETAIKNAKPKERPYKLTDGRGLFLLVHPNGGRWWRMRYRIWGRERLLSLGVYPDVSLKKARERREAARQLIADDVDPADVRRAEKVADKDLFSVLVKDWAGKQEWAPRTRVKNERAIKYLIGELGNRPVSRITTKMAYEALDQIAKRGPEVGKTAYHVLNQVMFRAATIGLIDANPVTGLSRVLPSVKRDSYAAITDPERFGKLLAAIDGYQGQPVVKCALQFLALVFTRPSEARLALWEEFDWKEAIWRVPAERTKARREHWVPLAPQTIELLEAVKLTAIRPSKWVFQGMRPGMPLSDNTLNVALRTMGFGDHVAHGFRSSASTMLNEQLKVSLEARDLQMQHWRKGVTGVYDRSELLDERRALMLAWADYIDKLRAEATK